MTEPTQSATFLLPQQITHEVMSDLARFIAMQRGEPIMIDGGQGGRIGAQTAQLLTVAVQTWAADQVAFQISDPAGSIAESVASIGLTEVFADVLNSEGVAA